MFPWLMRPVCLIFQKCHKVYMNSSTDGCMILDTCALKHYFSHTKVYFGVDCLDDWAVENAFLSSIELIVINK